MQFTTVIFFTLLTILSTALSTAASPVPLKRDVIVPHITSPQGGEVLHAGQKFTVTWDTSIVPPQSSNRAKIMLARPTEDSEHLDYQNPLASDFPLTSGSQEVTLPEDLETGDNYAFVLFGDSGNLSALFSVIGQ